MGKSSVADMFRELGAATIDSDDIVASLLDEKVVKGKIRGLFGIDVVDADGNLNKKNIANKIFKNKMLRNKLEVILHPLVLMRVDEQVKKVRNKDSIIIVEVPLLFEGGYHTRFNRTITVFADRKTALSRLKESGISRKDALLRMQSQMDIRTKKQRADYCIDNRGTRRQTQTQVKKIFQMLKTENRKKVS